MTDASEQTDPHDEGSDTTPGAHPGRAPGPDPHDPSAQLILPPGSRERPDDQYGAGGSSDHGDGEGDGDDEDADDGDEADGPSVEEPAKVMRIGAMVKRLLDEVREAPLDEDARARLASIHERSLTELEDGLSPDLVAELHRITLPFDDDRTPSEAELRVAQAQLVGWLEGLFHGIQTALVAQQIAAQQQLGQMRGLPPGLLHEQAGGPDGGGGPDHRPTPGQYL